MLLQLLTAARCGHGNCLLCHVATGHRVQRRGDSQSGGHSSGSAGK